MGELESIPSGNDTWPFVLTIAGMDPCGGAGVLADIKTFQRQAVYGLAVMTCNTIQTDTELSDLEWVEEERILKAIDKLSVRYAIQAVKIGVVKSRQMLRSILDKLHQLLPEAAIVWDPVFKASSQAAFFLFGKEERNGHFFRDWNQILKLCTIITPNAQEAAVLGQLTGLISTVPAQLTIGTLDGMIRKLASHTAVLLKAGHLEEASSLDRLYYIDSQNNLMVDAIGNPLKNVKIDRRYEKHGSGCVHSSTLTAAVARKHPLPEAAVVAKNYVEEFLMSTALPLGLHST